MSGRFEIDQWDATSKTIGFGKGGFQGARGNNVGAEWYVCLLYTSPSPRD